jgi:hypothetical protein
MTQPRCIITGETLTAETDSKAHVIPSALGGRLKPKGILSKTANTLVGDKIDLPLIEGFEVIVTLLDISRDRGTNQPIQMKDESGASYVVEFGEPLKLAAPRFEDVPTPDGPGFRIGARTLKEARTLLGRVKSKYPGFDIDEAMKFAVLAQDWPVGALQGTAEFGPGTVFPSTAPSP